MKGISSVLCAADIADQAEWHSSRHWLWLGHANLMIVAARRRTRLSRRMFGVIRRPLRRAERSVPAVPVRSTAVTEHVSRRAA